MARLAVLLFWLLLVSRAFADPQTRLADSEGSLLHRRIDLSQVKKWSPKSGTWQPLVLPKARVYVVNLWGVHCPPCLAEFPILRNMVAAWKSSIKSGDVAFLFIADPPLESPAVEVERFWQQPQVALPDADPCRTSDDGLRQALGLDVQPITLLLDENLVVRQAFVGAIGSRPLGSAIDRLLRVSPPIFGRHR